MHIHVCVERCRGGESTREISIIKSAIAACSVQTNTQTKVQAEASMSSSPARGSSHRKSAGVDRVDCGGVKVTEKVTPPVHILIDFCRI